MEKIRLLISQIVTCLVVATLTVLFCRDVIVSTGLINRFLKYQINSVSIALLMGILSVAALAIIIILWLIRRPMTEREIKEAEMGKVKNIPTEG